MKSAEGRSPGTFSMFCVGMFRWLMCGLRIEDVPVILANAATLVLASAVLVQTV